MSSDERTKAYVAKRTADGKTIGEIARMRADPAMVVASYERDPTRRRVSLPCCAQNHRINNTGNHYLNAPRHTVQPTKPQVTEPTQQTP